MTLNNIEILYNCQPTPGIILNIDSPDFTIASVNKAFLRAFHLENPEMIGKGYFEAFPINPDDTGLRTKNIKDAFDYVFQFKKLHQIKKHRYDIPTRKPDQLSIHYWEIDTYPLFNEEGEMIYIVQSFTDITSLHFEIKEKLKAREETQKSIDLDRLEKEVLELNSKKDVPIGVVLSFYASGIEALFPQMQCSILQIKNSRLYDWASPSLPVSYIQAIEGLSIGQNMGSCGTSAFLKQQVIVSDIATDPIWADFRHIALDLGLRACWSHPIISSEGEVLATFGIYYREVKSPDLYELNIIERATSLLKVILENKQYAETLKENELLISQGQEMAHFGNWSWDIRTDLVFWSDSLYAIYGLEKQNADLNFNSFHKILHPDDKERISTTIQGVLDTKINAEVEERIIRPDGEVRYLKSWKSVKCDENGTPVKVFGASLDITESKKIQEELLASESRLRSLVDAQTNYVIRLDLSGRYTYYNNKYKEDFSWIYGPGDFLGSESKLSVMPYHHDRLIETSKNCLDQPNTVFQVELNMPTRNGDVKSSFWHMIALTDSNNKPTEFQCIGIDTTDLIQAETALKTSNERYAYVNMATNDAIYDFDIHKNHIQWGAAFYRVFGYQFTQDTYPVENWTALIHEDDAEIVKKSFYDTLEDHSQTNWKAEYRFKKANGDYVFIEENGYIVRENNGHAVRMIGVLKDVTESKIAKSELEAAKNKYRDLFHLGPQPIFVYELGSLKFLDVNSALINLYGYSREEFLSMKITDLWIPIDLDNLNNIILQEIKTGVSHTNLSQHIKKSGEFIYVMTKGNSITYKGRAARIVIAIDYTDKIKAEQALIVSERLFKTLVEDGSDLITILDINGYFLYVSPNSDRLLYSDSLQIGNNAFEFIKEEEDREILKKEFGMLDKQKRIELSPFRITDKNNEIRWIQTVVTDLREDPAIKGIIANSMDITVRMEQELKIKEHLERYNIVSKATSDTVWDVNVLTGETRWNHGIQNIFGHKKVAGNDFWKNHVHPDDLQRVTAVVEENKRQRIERWTNEYRFLCGDGTYKFVLDRGFLTYDDTGRAVRMIGAMQDITERIHYIQTIEQKNIRLREIAWTQAHLVRAPLARIMGIINLMNEHSEDENREDLLTYLNISVTELDDIIRDIINKSQI